MNKRYCDRCGKEVTNNYAECYHELCKKCAKEHKKFKMCQRL